MQARETRRKLKGIITGILLCLGQNYTKYMKKYVCSSMKLHLEHQEEISRVISQGSRNKQLTVLSDFFNTDGKHLIKKLTNFF